MPVRKVSAKEMLGGKPLVMSANPAIVRGLKKLREMQSQAELSAAALRPSQQNKTSR